MVHKPWAAWFNTWLLAKLTPKGVVFSFFFCCSYIILCLYYVILFLYYVISLFSFHVTNSAEKQGQAHLLPELALGIDDQLALLITDALLELHYGLVGLSPIPGTIHLIGLSICAVAGVFLHQTYL